MTLILEMTDPNFVATSSFKMSTSRGKECYFYDGDALSIRRISKDTYAIGKDISSEHTVLYIKEDTLVNKMLPRISPSTFFLDLSEFSESIFNVKIEETTSIYDKLSRIPLIESEVPEQRGEEIVGLSVFIRPEGDF